MPAVLVTELTMSSGGRTIVNTHFACPQKDGQAELAWVDD